MGTNNYTCKLPINNSDSVCIVNSEWLTSEIKLLLLHDNQAWSGKLQLTENEDITELLDHLSLSKDTYIEESRKALTTHDGAKNFTYTLENDKFIWKKNVRKNMAVKFGNVHLLKVPLFEAFEKVLDNTLQLNLTLFTKLQNSDKQREVLEKENKILKSKLNEVVEKKSEMEETLYSQFLHLLNEKKRRIKEMKKKIPAGDNEELMQNDESDHFDSDTEIDSEEEDKLPVSKSSFEGSSLNVEGEPATLPKRTRQKRPNNESIDGPSGENLKVKDYKAVHPKRQAVNGRKGHRISGKSSCVIGQMPEEKDKNLSEASEDVFMFQKRSKITVNATHAVKPTTSKIKYESDEEIDSDNIEQPERDKDKTPGQINQGESINESVVLESMEINGTKNKDLKQETGGKNIKDNMISDEPKEVCENSDVTKKSFSRGLSSSTLDILNQLV